MKKFPNKNAKLKQKNAKLLEQVAQLRVELEEQKSIVENLTHENEHLLAENEEQRKNLKWYEDQLSIARKKQFGPSSERVHGQLSLFGDEPEPKQAKVINIGPYIRKKRQTTMDTLPEGIQTEVIECTLPEEERICPQCGEPMRVIGRSLARREVVCIPATMQIREYYQDAYACHDCDKNGTETPVMLIFGLLAELGARVVAQGRKNYLFCNTESGAKAAAMIYTIIETARAQNMNPYEYLSFIFMDMPNSDRPVDDYLPGSAYLPQSCYITRPQETDAEPAIGVG